MSLILGKEYCKIDSNGRFKFPIALKRQLEDGDNRFVIRQSLYAKCLELWTYSSFQAEVEHLQKKLNPYKIEDRKILRKLTDGNIIELDTNDRLLIPAEQKDRIKSTKDIVLQSTGNYIEIWAYDTYNEMNAETPDPDFATKIDERLGGEASCPAEE
ncbi:MAG: hypothetical protein KBT45_08435 [Bacteroidales bacterium]|nr:hypothetical protein [Candidatus Colimorpha pelethequi]MCQ2261626.1 hypothetical protein [Bacteroidales bacterium]